MTVTPYRYELLQNQRDLYHLISTIQQTTSTKTTHQIISFSLEIDAIDPLVALQKLIQPHQPFFYFETPNTSQQHHNSGGKIALAAIGATAAFNLPASHRFQTVQDFIQRTLSRITCIGNSNHSLAGPHFLCGFTFFEDDTSTSAAFPPATVFLPTWQIASANQRSTLVMNLPLHADASLDVVVDETWAMVRRLQSLRYERLILIPEKATNLKVEPLISPERFQRSVRSTLRLLHAKTLQKVVLANAVDVVSPQSFQPIHSLQNLRRFYPDCHIFALGNGRGQQFLGASPERLVSLHDRQLMTDALAGSASRGKTPWEDAHLAETLRQSHKEQYEHAVVAKFITQQLQHLGLEPEAAPQQLRQLANIQHLHTPIAASVPSSLHLLDIVAQLHPTPAVAGLPRTKACEVIRQVESFERSLYAAPIGWIDHRGNGEFVVGIRSAMLDGCHARLFAGAGIVAQSNPQQELAEVQLKLRALLPALV